MSKTGIICTLGPATRSPAVLKEMADAGMAVARLNFSHGAREEHEKYFALIKTLNKKYKKSVKILADLEGHRIRVGDMAGGKVQLKKKQKLILTNKEVLGTGKKIHIDYPYSLTGIKKGMDIFIDDGNLKLKVLSSGKDKLTAEVQTDYALKNNKGVNIPRAKLKFPPMSDRDRENMLFALSRGADFIANSFVRNAGDMAPLKDILKKEKNKKCRLIAKIEDHNGIDHLTSILDACDGVMVARGDMGISIPVWKVPVVQKYIIKKCRFRKKIAITATQMLESMAENLMPTRAEVSDVANAVMDGSDYVMLSAETAVGKHPAQTVQMMNNIVKFTKKHS